MIFQEPMTSLNPVYTVGEQIAEAVRLHEGVGAKEATRARARDARARRHPRGRRAGCDDYPHQLSGGMRQRVMIAMALACNPKLLIADEPTTALDVTIQAQILELMSDLRERLGMAIMLITHDLGVVAETCDDVVVMYGGRVVERGPVEDVFSSPQHPYTEALLQSIPMLGMTQAEPLRVIRGNVPSPLNWPQGCRFAPRCDYAFDRCLEELPPLYPAGAQESACFLCEHGRRGRRRPARRCPRMSAAPTNGAERRRPRSRRAASRSTSRSRRACCARRSRTSRPSTASTSRCAAARRSASSASRAAASRRSAARSCG